MRKEALVIHAWEREFAEKLYPLIPTPRAAKRFSNIYRILKARVRREHLATFEGTQDKPGNFQIPMLLLAMLIGSPEICTKLFPIIRKQSEQNVELAMIFGSLKSNGSTRDIEALQAKVMGIISAPDFPNAPWV